MRQLIPILLLLCLPAFGSVYYVDFQSGDDTHVGTSTGTAWKTIPGTRTTDFSTWQSTAWGSTFSGSSKVPSGTIFLLKGGAIQNTNNGGRILIDTTFYTDSTFSNPITFRLATNWGTGSATFDGRDIPMTDSGEGLIKVSNMGGVVLDGVVADGIKVINSERIGFDHYLGDNGSGIQFAEGCGVYYCRFVNNGTDYSVYSNAGAGSGHVYFGGGSGVNRTIGNAAVRHCTFDGNGLYFNGTCLGQSDQRVTNCIVADCSAYNFLGDDDSDTAMAFKAFNSQIVFTNCEGSMSCKGMDLGSESPLAAWEITYTLINCYLHDNRLFGLGLSDEGTDWAGPGTRTTNVNYYAINCIVVNNNAIGIKAYSSPYNLYVVHCVLSGQAFGVLGHPNGIADTGNYITVHYYNNCFYKPLFVNNSDYGNLGVGYWLDTMTKFHFYSDYNSYVQTSTELFSVWGAYGGGSDVHQFGYGANGPGQISGTWWAFNSSHNDSHSVGTGSSVSTASPPFLNAAGGLYTLTAHYPGTNLSSMPWYIPAMGVDRNGVTRTSWDMGAYEYVPTSVKIIGASALRACRL